MQRVLPRVFAAQGSLYLFGCNTLKPEPRHTLRPRSCAAFFARAAPPRRPARLSACWASVTARAIATACGTSSSVPVVYGFSSKAPLGRSAGPLFDRYFQSAPPDEIGSGPVSAKLLGLFEPSSMTVTYGLDRRGSEARLRAATYRSTIDSRTRRKSPSCTNCCNVTWRRCDVFLDHLERISIDSSVRRGWLEDGCGFRLRSPATRDARERYLDFARDADQPAVRTR